MGPKKETMSQTVDLSLNIEKTPGGAIVFASWRVVIPDNAFNVQIEAVCTKGVDSCVALMSDIQVAIVTQIESWNNKNA